MTPALSTLLLLATPQSAAPARAQQQVPDPRAANRPSVEQSAATTEGDIVVIGRRGDAKVPSETEIGEAEIAAHGADSIGALLDQLRPFIDETGEQPVLLVNGRPVGLDRSLLAYPPEALERVAVLQRDAAARYGQPGDRRVVNLVLKAHFTSTDAEAGVFGPTAGGQGGGLLTARRVAISGDTRWNANLRFEGQRALLRSARGLSPRIAPPPGVDPDDYETLLPSRRNLVGSIGATRPIGSFTGSLTIDASDVGSKGLRGLAIDDGAERDRAFRSENSSRSLGATISLAGDPGGWQTNFSAIASRSWSDSFIESALVDATRNRGVNDSLLARLNVNKSVLTLPAGPLTTSFSLNLLENRSRNRQTGVGAEAARIDDQSRRQIDGDISIGIPVSRPSSRKDGLLGRLSLQVSAGARTLSGSGTRTQAGGGVIWAPVHAIELRGNVERAGTTPTVDQLDGPLVTTIVRLFDYTRRETVEVARLTGGNAALARGRRSQTSLTAKLLPFTDQRLTLSTTYRRQTLSGGALAFPELTPTIEAAFPERVRRDADGQLIALDARPIAIQADETAELFSSATVRFSRPSRVGPASGQPEARASPWTFDLSLSDRWRLRDRLLIRDGVPAIDRLSGAGGQSRHTIALRGTAGHAGFGASFDANWSSATSVSGGTSTIRDGFRVRPPVLLNLETFVRLGGRAPPAPGRGWFDDTMITLSVQNILNDYRRVTSVDGAVPPGYSRYEVDPAGRTLRLVMRKRF